jgi:hypothetical protein
MRNIIINNFSVNGGWTIALRTMIGEKERKE